MNCVHGDTERECKNYDIYIRYDAETRHSETYQTSKFSKLDINLFFFFAMYLSSFSGEIWQFFKLNEMTKLTWVRICIKYAIHVLHNYNLARFWEYLRKITLVLLDVQGYPSCYTSRTWCLSLVLWRRLCGSEFPDQRGQVKY